MDDYTKQIRKEKDVFAMALAASIFPRLGPNFKWHCGWMDISFGVMADKIDPIFVPVPEPKPPKSIEEYGGDFAAFVADSKHYVLFKGYRVPDWDENGKIIGSHFVEHPQPPLMTRRDGEMVYIWANRHLLA